jgi:hypothetical protein
MKSSKKLFKLGMLRNRLCIFHSFEFSCCLRDNYAFQSFNLPLCADSPLS